MPARVQLVGRKNFAPFGTVVEGPAGKPTSQAAEYKFWSDIAHYAIDGETEIGICTVYRRPESTVAELERHLRTPEILIPIDAPFILPLTNDNGGYPRIRAFRVKVGQAVVINSGAWHGACLPSGTSQASYFVIFRKNTPREDVEKRTIAPVKILR